MGKLIYAFKKLVGNRTGNLKKKWEYDSKSIILTSPIVAQLDNNKNPEIFFGTKEGKVFSLDSNAKVKWIFDSKEKMNEWKTPEKAQEVISSSADNALSYYEGAYKVKFDTLDASDTTFNNTILSGLGVDKEPAGNATKTEKEEWNQKNKDPLKESYITGQINWHKKQKESVAPPNCFSEGYYEDILVCEPDNLCKTIKNPVSYAFKKYKKTENPKNVVKKKKEKTLVCPYCGKKYSNARWYKEHVERCINS